MWLHQLHFFFRIYCCSQGPNFVTSSPTSSPLCPISFPFSIVEKWLSISASSLAMNRLHGVLTLQKKVCHICVHCESLFTVLKHLAAALFLPQHSLRVDEGACAFPRPKHSLPRDYPSFCSEPLELLTQLLPTEKLCICINTVYMCVCVCLTPLPSTVHGSIMDTVACLWYCHTSSFHWLLFSVTKQICSYCTLYFTL